MSHNGRRPAASLWFFLPALALLLGVGAGLLYRQGGAGRSSRPMSVPTTRAGRSAAVKHETEKRKGALFYRVESLEVAKPLLDSPRLLTIKIMVANLSSPQAFANPNGPGLELSDEEGNLFTAVGPQGQGGVGTMPPPFPLEGGKKFPFYLYFSPENLGKSRQLKLSIPGGVIFLLDSKKVAR